MGEFLLDVTFVGT